MWHGANQRSATDRPAGGSGSGAFVVDAPFSVTTTGGLNDGDTLTIDLLTGTFPPRLYGNSPMLYDDVDHQWQNGVNADAWNGFTDGQSIGLGTIYRQQTHFNSPDVMGVWTSQPLRTTYQTHVYGTVDFSITNGKAWLGGPRWPAAWGTRNNSTLYLTFWARSVNPFTLGTTSLGAGTFTNKQCRFTTAAEPGTNDPLIGIDCFSGVGGYTSHSNNSQGDNGPYRGSADLGGTGSAGAWLRHEYWREALPGPTQYSSGGQLVEGWVGRMGAGQRYVIRSHSDRGGQFEACHPADVMYQPANVPLDSWWDSQNFPGATAYAYVNDELFGFDDSGTGGGSLGNSYYISEVYTDPDLWRFELSDSLTWDQGPTSVVNREIQGHWSRDSDTQCTVQVKRGQFSASQTGLALWLVNSNDRQSAIRVLHN